MTVPYTPFAADLPFGPARRNEHKDPVWRAVFSARRDLGRPLGHGGDVCHAWVNITPARKHVMAMKR
jgi:hypothetical protein